MKTQDNTRFVGQQQYYTVLFKYDLNVIEIAAPMASE